MKKKRLVVSYLIFSPLLLLAQIVSGQVSDVEGQPVPFAHVALLCQADSTIVAGTATDEKGSFKSDIQSHTGSSVSVSGSTSQLSLTASSASVDASSLDYKKVEQTSMQGGKVILNSKGG